MSRKLIYGVGVNDLCVPTEKRQVMLDCAGQKISKAIWKCPFYRVWINMLQRCYSKTALAKRPTYAGCFVVDEWHRFSAFRSWMQGQDWEGNQLDKDILCPGNKVYGPENCVFVSPAVNMFVTDAKAIRGKCKIGVTWNNFANKFQARCRNQFTKKFEYLGNFDSEEEAHEAWRKRKHELACQLAEQQTDSRVAQALIQRYASTGQEV